MDTHSNNLKKEPEGLFWLASRPSVIKRASKVAVVVGIVLATINHGDKIMQGLLSATDLLKILLTFFVPFCVSTFSSVLAIREKSQFIESLEGK